MPGEPAHMHLINYQILNGQIDRAVMPPVEILIGHPCPVRIDLIVGRLGEPDVASTDFTSIRIEQNSLRIEKVSGLRIIRSFHPEAVFCLFVVQIVDDHGVHIADLTLRGERDLRIGSGLPFAEEHKRAGGGVGGVDREIHPARHMTRPIRKGMSVTQPESSVLMSMMKGSAHQSYL